MLTDSVMKIEAPDGAVSEVQRKAGECYQRPAGIEHDVMNGSEHPMAFIEIEVVRADSEAKRPVIPTEGGHPIRSKAATDSDRRRPPC